MNCNFLNEAQIKEAAVTGQKMEGLAKKPYAAPQLRKYGKVEALTQSTSRGSFTDGSGKKRTTSDLRCKQNIVRIGDHPWGFGLYLFEYLPGFEHNGKGVQFGVIAQEVERVVPAAVSFDAQGLRRVDYAQLGIVH